MKNSSKQTKHNDYVKLTFLTVLEKKLEKNWLCPITNYIFKCFHNYQFLDVKTIFIMIG